MKRPHSCSSSSLAAPMQEKLEDYSKTHGKRKNFLDESINSLYELETEILTDSKSNRSKIDEFEAKDCKEFKKKRIEIDDPPASTETKENNEKESNCKSDKSSQSAAIDNVIESFKFEKAKLTRAKAKELALSMPDLLWPLTPAKKGVSPQLQTLVEDDLLHEDSSDDEYDPNKDSHQPSEDEGDNLTCSDVESEPLTPPANSETSTLLDVNHTDKDFHNFNELLKDPEPPCGSTEEENIGQRTRSKFCLNQTALEDLERQLPTTDIPSDFDYCSYLMDDENWGEIFRSTEQNCDDDIEADPNYIFDDYEKETVDKEELRSDKGVKVTKKEMKSLYNELREFIDLEKPGVEQPRKRKSFENSLGNSSFDDPISAVGIEPVPERDKSPEMKIMLSEEQGKIMALQLGQHVQLVAQHFLMSYMHPVPEIHDQSKICKENLKDLLELKFDIINLSDAVKLVNRWEEKLNNEEKFRENYVEDLEKNVEIGKRKKKIVYVAKFNSELSRIMMESEALMYSSLLPTMPFRAETLNAMVNFYPESEKNLLAISLERHIPYKLSMCKKFICSFNMMRKVVPLICKELMPHKDPDYLHRRIKRLRDNSSPDNPIKFFFKHGYVPALSHDYPLNVEKKAPRDQEFDSLPEVWQDYLLEEKKRKNNSTTSTASEDNNLGEDLLTLPSEINLNDDKISESNILIEENVDDSSGLEKDTVVQESSTAKSILNVELDELDEENGDTDGPDVSVHSDGSSKEENDTENCDEITEIESLKRRLEAGSHGMKEEEPSLKFAASFIENLHSILKSINPEALKNAIKYYLEYSDKLKEIKVTSQNKKEKVAVDFQKNLSVLLKDHPKLCSDVLPLFSSQQVKIADEINEDVMSDFEGLTDVESSGDEEYEESMSEEDENENSENEMNQSSDGTEESFESEGDEREEDDD